MSTKAHNLSKYQLVECIGRGGMGEVWKAFDTQLMRYVAIKLLHPGMQQDPDFIMRFEQEARLIASLRHPNIVKIHNFHVSYPPESDPPLCYMVMDYIEGETLGEYIRNTSRCGQFPPPGDIVYIFTVVGLALDHAHQCNLIHRDIKPANILLDKRVSTAKLMGEPILTDFGIARHQGVTSGTVIGSVMGTPKYMAPEQAQGKYDDPRSDLYSLGVILYEVMTGETPFHADMPLAIMMQHLQEQPKPPELTNPRISPAISEVILKSIAKDPNARFPTAAAMALALTQAFNIPTPEHLGDPDGSTLPGSPSSAISLTYVPPLRPPSEAQTPLIQSMPFTGSQSSQPIKDFPGAERSIDSITPKDFPADRKMPIKSKKTWVIALPALLVLALLGSVLIGRILASPPSITPPTGGIVIGHVSFIKNGLSLNYNAARIDIAHVPELPQGMAYYAWIELPNGQQGENVIPPHWQLTLSQQAIHTPPLTFAGIDNLYVPRSLFLITKEQTANPPIVPDTNPAARLYYAPVTSNSSATLDLRQCPTSDIATICFS